MKIILSLLYWKMLSVCWKMETPCLSQRAPLMYCNWTVTCSCHCVLCLLYVALLPLPHTTGYIYLRQNECSEHWWRLSNHVFCLSVSLCTWGLDAAAPAWRHNSNDVIIQRKQQRWHTVIINSPSISHVAKWPSLSASPFPIFTLDQPLLAWQQNLRQNWF